jgi:tetratricopeptide (TPR) repeat protein
VLRTVASRAFDIGRYEYCWQIAWTLGPYLLRYAPRYEDAAARRLALKAAEQLGDPGLLARSLSECACPGVHVVDTAQAHQMLDQSIGIFTSRSDLASLAMAHHRRAMLFDSRGQTSEAFPPAHEALRLRIAVGDPVWVAYAENALSWCYVQAGDFEQARAHGQHAVDLLREADTRVDLADALDTLGRSYYGLGAHREAIASYLEAISLYQEAGNVVTEHMALTALGDAYLDSGDPDSARDAWERALSVAPEEADALRDRLAALNDITLARRPA